MIQLNDISILFLLIVFWGLVGATALLWLKLEEKKAIIRYQDARIETLRNTLTQIREVLLS